MFGLRRVINDNLFKKLTFPELHEINMTSFVWSLGLFLIISKGPTATSVYGNARQSVDSQQKSNYFFDVTFIPLHII